MKALYISPEGIVKYISDCPEPDRWAMSGEWWKFNKYEAALASAKQSAIEFSDSTFARQILWELLNTSATFNSKVDFIPDTIHPFPEDRYDVEVRGGHYNPDWITPLAVITPKPSPSIPMNYAQRAIRDEHGKVIRFEPFDKGKLKAACKEAKTDAKQLTKEILSDSKNALIGSPSIERQEELTDADFCQMYTSFYGEEIDDIRQIVRASFTGQELMEFVQHCLLTRRKD